MFETLALSVMLASAGVIAEPVELPAPTHAHTHAPAPDPVHVETETRPAPAATYTSPTGETTQLDLRGKTFWRCVLDDHTVEGDLNLSAREAADNNCTLVTFQ
jgi:hypothetical protein